MKDFLTDEQRKELLRELKVEDKARYSDRIKVILLLDKGWTYKKISEALFLDEGTIANYRKRYCAGGIEQLIDDHYRGGCYKLDENQLIELQLHLTTKIYANTQVICNYIKNKYHVTYSLSGILTLLYKLGFSYKKAKGVPGKAVKEQQEKFLAVYSTLKSQEGKIYFCDSTHPQYNPIFGCGWIRIGEEFEVKTNNGRAHLNITGAIEINSREVITRTHDKVNSQSICDLLRAIKNKNPNEVNISLIMDNAAYNRSKKVTDLALELSIRLIYLPPYSPNLNPIERLWKFMKKKIFYNQHYDTFSDFGFASATFFRGIRKYKDELISLITDNFRVVGV